jgi:excisionase family DNA binding protein
MSPIPVAEMTVAEAAAESCYSTRTIEAKIASGELASVKRGGRRIVPRSAFEAWCRRSAEPRSA